MNTNKRKNGIRLTVGIFSGVLVGLLTSKIALWLPIGTAIGAALEYAKKTLM